MIIVLVLLTVVLALVVIDATLAHRLANKVAAENRAVLNEVECAVAETSDAFMRHIEWHIRCLNATDPPKARDILAAVKADPDRK